MYKMYVYIIYAINTPLISHYFDSVKIYYGHKQDESKNNEEVLCVLVAIFNSIYLTLYAKCALFRECFA